MIFEKNDVVVVPFPFTDKVDSKRRPVVVLSNSEFHHSTNHVIVVMITTAKNSDWLSDLVIQNTKLAGLTSPCVIRMKVFTLSINLILKRIGKLSAADAKELREKLSAVM